MSQDEDLAPKFRSQSYRPMTWRGNVEHCGIGWLDDRQNEPCWGQVEMVDYYATDEGEAPIIACEGHADFSVGGPYVPETGASDEG